MLNQLDYYVMTYLESVGLLFDDISWIGWIDMITSWVGGLIFVDI